MTPRNGQDWARDVLFEAVEEVNRVLPPEQRLALSLDTVLFGMEGRLDSIGLVTLVLAVEEKLNARVARPISLSDERAMSQRNSPFRSLATMHAYILMLTDEQADSKDAAAVDPQ